MERKINKEIEDIILGIINVEKNDINNENANMSSATPSGMMQKVATEITKLYSLENLISPKFSKAHKNGEIHIHDLDYYPTKTTTCLQYDLEPMFENGFHTKHGFIREAKSITTYATLATIIFQTNQNEQHGGQAIPAFDFYMAKGVLKSFRRHFRYRMLNLVVIEHDLKQNERAKEYLNQVIKSIKMNEETILELAKYFEVSSEEIKRISKIAYEDTKSETYQAMEAFLHNLNTMHSRGGNQVVFSSINYGTDTSPEGRMVIRELLKATENGLGKSETPIFPIQIFKVKEGENYCDKDYEYALKNADTIFENIDSETKYKFETPNFDLLLLACRTTSKRLFPNFVFLDSEFNKHENWKKEDPMRYKYEIATMGCRTRVFENVNGEKSSLGRGNLSFTSINFPRIAIQVRKEVEALNENIEEIKNELLKTKFIEKVKELTYLVAEQLLERYNFQKTALTKQFPFMTQNNLWKNLGKLNPNEEIGDAINTGTLGIGFVGGANAMYALFNKEHSQSELAYNTLYEAINEMNKIVNEFKDRKKLNFSIIATPAESLAGRFARIDRKDFGIIENVTDRDYYVNSFHIDVKQPISMFDKITKEAPFHAITKGGHITYIELDGEARKNVIVILKLVKVMKDAQIGYGSINHPVDRCKQCGFSGIIYNDECPICKSKNISRIRRITGYLTGDLENWNTGKRSEEKDRIKHK